MSFWVIRKRPVELSTWHRKSLYKGLVRPTLEYTQIVWSPYSDTLKSLNMTTLSCRRARGDMLETFKIKVHQQTVHHWTALSPQPADGGDDHQLKLEKGRARLDVHIHSSQWVINLWCGTLSRKKSSPPRHWTLSRTGLIATALEECRLRFRLRLRLPSPSLPTQLNRSTSPRHYSPLTRHDQMSDHWPAYRFEEPSPLKRISVSVDWIYKLCRVCLWVWRHSHSHSHRHRYLLCSSILIIAHARR